MYTINNSEQEKLVWLGQLKFSGQASRMCFEEQECHIDSIIAEITLHQVWFHLTGEWEVNLTVRQ